MLSTWLQIGSVWSMQRNISSPPSHIMPQVAGSRNMVNPPPLSGFWLSPNNYNFGAVIFLHGCRAFLVDLTAMLLHPPFLTVYHFGTYTAGTMTLPDCCFPACSLRGA